MTNPNTPEQPQGTGPVQGEPQPAPFAPQPYGEPVGYPQQPYPAQGQPPQPVYPAAAQAPQQPYPQFYPQQPAPAVPAPERQPRQSRPRTDPNGVPYGVGPFTLREAIFLGATALVLVASFLPFLSGDYSDVFGYASAWAPAGWLVVPAALVLVAAAALILARRLAAPRRLSVGSLSADQFASVASLVTAGFYLGALFLIAGFPAWFGGGSDILQPGAGVIVGLVFSLVAVAVTTLAPALPIFSAEFASRHETTAHPLARPASAVARRPRAERPAAAPPRPAPYPGQPGMPMPQAGPGQFAAYKRKGSQLDPLPADDHATPYFPAPAAGAAVGAVAYQPQQEMPAVPEPDAESAVQQKASAGGQPVPESPVVEHLRAEPSAQDPAEVVTSAESPVDATGPADTAGERQAVAPGFVATDVPTVDPLGTAALPIQEHGHRDDADRLDDELDDATHDAAPMSALGHVSARTASGSVPDSSGPISEQPTAVFSTQPFWVYSPVPRPVVDEVSGATVFEIGPSAWALAIMDRGSELVLRHDDGRVGVLRNLEGITRG